MLKKLYVNNFKCLVNFEIKFSNINLLLGANGSGKTTVFEVLHKLQKFILGEFETTGKYYQVSEIFHQQDLTRWQNSPIQKKDMHLPNEKIAIFVPARNIETWFSYINGKDVNEEDDYKDKTLNITDRITLAKASAEKLASDICPQGLDENAPASLHHACNELRRLQLD
ncbi:MAG: AAA family ATPase [Okeania sp. SIO1H6]|nr:AAA family ATPase [Okeania sp. SIO1H6]